MVSLFHWIPCLHHQLVAHTLMHHLMSCSGIFLFQSIPCLRHPAIAPSLPCISRFKSKLLSSSAAFASCSLASSLTQWYYRLSILLILAVSYIVPFRFSRTIPLRGPHFLRFMLLPIVYARSDCAESQVYGGSVMWSMGLPFVSRYQQMSYAVSRIRTSHL